MSLCHYPELSILQLSLETLLVCKANLLLCLSCKLILKWLCAVSSHVFGSLSAVDEVLPSVLLLS